jgi:hypothetical protein
LKIPALNTLVLLEWLDSTSMAGWQYYEPEEKLVFQPRLMRTVGWLLGVNPVALLIAGTISPETLGDARTGSLDPLAIPRGCILELKAIKL